MTAKLFPLYNANGQSTCPMGMAMNQNRLAVPTWSYAMEVQPPQRVVELGTNNAGMTTALALHCKMIGARLITYDTGLPDERIGPVAMLLGVEFRRADIWASEREIAALITAPGRVFLLCDGGDKQRELAMFAQYVKPGDVIATHDYDAIHEIDPGVPQLERYWPWGECTQAMARPIAEAWGLEPFLQDHFDIAGWLAWTKP
jgi:hypothetical protein